MAGLIIYASLFVAVFISFWASLIEATYLTVAPLSLYSAGKGGSKKAESALRITEEKTKLVSVTTFLDTLSNVALASTIGIILSELFGPLGWVVSVLIGSLIIMVFLYLLPKAMGIENSVQIAIWLAPYSSALIRVLAPVAIPLTNFSTRVSRLFFGGKDYSPRDLVDEFEDYLTLMEDEGHIEPNVGRLLRTTLVSSNYDASNVATKIEKTISVNKDMKVVDALKVMSSSLHPRLPVLAGDGEYVGAITFRSLAGAIAQEKLSDPVSNYMVQAARVASDDSLVVVAEKMSRLGTAIAFVYEGERIVGVITLSDLLERLLGLGIR